jgi:hypothetical protein
VRCRERNLAWELGSAKLTILSLAKLTVFTAAAVVPAECGIRAIVSILTGNAQANAGHGLSARLGNTAAAFGAMDQGWTLGQAALRTADPILYGRVDLILYCTVTRPTGRHLFTPDDAMTASAAASSLYGCAAFPLQA